MLLIKIQKSHDKHSLSNFLLKLQKLSSDLHHIFKNSWFFFSHLLTWQVPCCRNKVIFESDRGWPDSGRGLVLVKVGPDPRGRLVRGKFWSQRIEYCVTVIAWAWCGESWLRLIFCNGSMTLLSGVGKVLPAGQIRSAEAVCPARGVVFQHNLRILSLNTVSPEGSKFFWIWPTDRKKLPTPGLVFPKNRP